MNTTVLSHLFINKNHHEPVYLQLAHCLLGAINRGDITVGEQLPTVDILCEVTGLSRMTIQRAMQILHQKGCIAARRGRGAFVIAAAPQSHDRLSIGFVARPNRNPHTDPFYSEILLGVAKEAQRQMIDLAFTYGEDELTTHGFPLLRKVKALILAGQMSDTFHRYLQRESIACVWVDALPVDIPWDAVTINQHKSGRLVARHLLELGHRRILYLDGHPEIQAYQDRFDGFQQVFSGNESAQIDRCFGAQMAQSGREAIQRAMLGQFEYTAVVGCNDMVAIGAMNELQDRGFHVPEDISIAGFNDVSFTTQSRPALTTVHIPKQEMGARAVQLLMHRLQYPQAICESVLLDVRLVERQSTSVLSTRRELVHS